jgi:hypothetical protein
VEITCAKVGSAATTPKRKLIMKKLKQIVIIIKHCDNIKRLPRTSSFVWVLAQLTPQFFGQKTVNLSFAQKLKVVPASLFICQPGKVDTSTSGLTSLERAQ